MCRQLALEGGKCLSQLSVRARLARTEVDPKRAVFSGTTGLSGAAVNIPAPGDLEADESRGHDGQLWQFKRSRGRSAAVRFPTRIRSECRRSAGGPQA